MLEIGQKTKVTVLNQELITSLPRLINLCDKMAEKLPPDSDPVLELKALRDSASEILQLIEEK